MNHDNDNAIRVTETTATVTTDRNLWGFFYQKNLLEVLKANSYNNYRVSTLALIWTQILKQSWAAPAWHTLLKLQHKKAVIFAGENAHLFPVLIRARQGVGEGSKKLLNNMIYHFATFEFFAFDTTCYCLNDSCSKQQ